MKISFQYSTLYSPVILLFFFLFCYVAESFATNENVTIASRTPFETEGYIKSINLNDNTIIVGEEEFALLANTQIGVKTWKTTFTDTNCNAIPATHFKANYYVLIGGMRLDGERKPEIHGITLLSSGEESDSGSKNSSTVPSATFHLEDDVWVN